MEWPYSLVNNGKVYLVPYMKTKTILKITPVSGDKVDRENIDTYVYFKCVATGECLGGCGIWWFAHNAEEVK